MGVALPARAQISVYAYTDKTEMGEAETLAYTLEITGDLSTLAPIRPPDARGLVLARSTPVLQSTLVVNGQQRQTIRWLYEPQRAGDATILSTRIEAGGRTYRTDPIDITVVPQAQRSPRASRMAPTPTPQAQDDEPLSDGDLFLRAEPSSRRVVVGEQIVVDYVLYYAPNLRPHGSPQLATALNTDGFWREALDVPAQDLYPRDVTVGDEAMRAVTVFRLALFPTRSGTLELSPIEFQIDLVRSERRTRSPFGSLFSPFTSRFVKERVRAPGLSVTVNPLPDGAPASFDGAVGQFGLAAYTDRDAVTVGEPVELTVEIRGTGNIATLAAPTLPDLPGVETFDPQNTQTINRQTTPLSGVKTFAYTLVPRGGGSMSIPPVSWSYFDPEAGAYETLRSATFPLEVAGAPLTTQPDGDIVDLAVPLGLMAENDWRRAQDGGSLPLGAVLGGLALPLLALLGLLIVRRRKDEAATLSPERRALRAHPEAARRLQAASTLPSAKARYAEVEGTLRQFLSERFALAATNLPRTALATVLAQQGVTDSTRRALDRLLGDCERAQFAPPDGTMQAASSAATEQAAALIAALDADAQPVHA